MGRWMAIAASAALLGFLGAGGVQAATETLKGTLASDDAVALFSITVTGKSDLSVSTDSYGGGSDLDGSATVAGGFVPIISLFSPTGAFIVDDGADIAPPGAIDPATGVADYAAFSVNALAPGVYTLAVSEFFNFPNGDLSAGFFEAGQGNFTGPTCGQSAGSFLQTNLISCPQRTDAFTVNLSTTGVPEPATYSLLISALGALGARLRRNGAQTARRASGPIIA